MAYDDLSGAVFYYINSKTQAEMKKCKRKRDRNGREGVRYKKKGGRKIRTMRGESSTLFRENEEHWGGGGGGRLLGGSTFLGEQGSRGAGESLPRASAHLALFPLHPC